MSMLLLLLLLLLPTHVYHHAVDCGLL